MPWTTATIAPGEQSLQESLSQTVLGGWHQLDFAPTGFCLPKVGRTNWIWSTEYATNGTVD
jgi:hypothetical protein